FRGSGRVKDGAQRRRGAGRLRRSLTRPDPRKDLPASGRRQVPTEEVLAGRAQFRMATATSSPSFLDPNWAARSAALAAQRLANQPTVASKSVAATPSRKARSDIMPNARAVAFGVWPPRRLAAISAWNS